MKRNRFVRYKKSSLLNEAENAEFKRICKEVNKIIQHYKLTYPKIYYRALTNEMCNRLNAASGLDRFVLPLSERFVIKIDKAVLVGEDERVWHINQSQYEVNLFNQLPEDCKENVSKIFGFISPTIVLAERIPVVYENCESASKDKLFRKAANDLNKKLGGWTADIHFNNIGFKDDGTPVLLDLGC